MIIATSLIDILSFNRIHYNVTSPEAYVFCNLSQGHRGKPLVKEAFRKMLNTLLESEVDNIIVQYIHVHCNHTEAEIVTVGLRTHSCRRTGAYYASWLGVPESTIKVYVIASIIVIVLSCVLYI